MKTYRDPTWLRRKYIDERLSQQAIADLCGVSLATIQNWMEKFGIASRSFSEAHKGRKLSLEHIEKIRRSKIGKPRPPHVQEMLRSFGHYGKSPSKVTRQRLSETSRMESNPNWRGGRLVSRGRVYLKRPDHPHATKAGYVARARLMMEEMIRRYLLPQEVVHHIDGDVSNDDSENLQLFPDSASHSAHHGRISCNLHKLA